MATPLVQYFVRYLIARAVSNGEDIDYARLGMMFSDIAATINSCVSRLSGITNADGSLKNFPTTGALTLTSATRTVATASQTAFTVAEYNTSTDTAIAFSGSSLIDSSSVAKTDATTVTIPAQAVSTVVTIWIFSTGSGTLTRLADTDTGEGASLIGVEDDADLYTGEDVETCLAEVMQRIADLETDVGDTSNIIRPDGSVPFTDAQSMGDQLLTDLAAGVDDHDAVRMDQISSAAIITIISPVLNAFYLQLAGGTMSGAIDMDSNLINNVTDGAAAGDAVNKGQLDLKLDLAGGTMTGDVDFDGNAITGLPAPADDTDPVRLIDMETEVPLNETSGFLNHIVYASGTTAFTVPAGVTKIMVEMWGGGGAGQVGGGGGGGAYGKQILTVVPGHALSAVVGAGGAAHASNDPAASGGDSILNNTTLASELARAGGGVGAITAQSGASAAGGTSSMTINIAGERGGRSPDNVTATAMDIGGKGGNSPHGGTGGLGAWGAPGDVTPTTSSQAGAVPGGGGGGWLNSAGSLAGASGAAGRIIIFY